LGLQPDPPPPPYPLDSSHVGRPWGNARQLQPGLPPPPTPLSNFLGKSSRTAGCLAFPTGVQQAFRLPEGPRLKAKRTISTTPPPHTPTSFTPPWQAKRRAGPCQFSLHIFSLHGKYLGYFFFVLVFCARHPGTPARPPHPWPPPAHPSTQPASGYIWGLGPPLGTILGPPRGSAGAPGPATRSKKSQNVGFSGCFFAPGLGKTGWRKNLIVFFFFFFFVEIFVYLFSKIYF
jgi:hypothetical protein